MEYKAGQIFEDKDHKLHCEKNICFCYLLLSFDEEEDGTGYWKCAVFMEYKFGASIRLLTEKEMSPLHYMGHIQSFQGVNAIPNK